MKILCSLWVLLGLGSASAATFTKVWTVTGDISAPESAYFDPESGFIFVSNIAGEPTAKDSNGWISKLDSSGKVIQSKWLTGLDAPKGLRARNGILWVTNIDELVSIKIAEARITARIKIEGAQFLNDPAISDDGTVYVSDTVSSRIYAVRDGKASVFAEGKQLQHPNGLFFEPGHLIVGGWGKDMKADWSTSSDGQLYSIDLKSKTQKWITAKPLGHLDGIEADPSGKGWIVSDWMAGKVFSVSRNGVTMELVSGFKHAADIGVVARPGLLLVPDMGTSSVTAYSGLTQK